MFKKTTSSKKVLFGAFLFLAAVPSFTNADYGHGSGSMMGFGGFGGGIFMLLFWSLAILGIIFVVKYLLQNSNAPDSKNSALDILKERYAKGEIEKKEFEEKKKDLTK